VDASKRLVTTAEAARLLGLSERTLEVWRVKPRRSLYRSCAWGTTRSGTAFSDIAKWIGPTHRSTSDYMLPDDPIAA
jgi:hypothetical protein